MLVNIFEARPGQPRLLTPLFEWAHINTFLLSLDVDLLHSLLKRRVTATAWRQVGGSKPISPVTAAR